MFTSIGMAVKQLFVAITVFFSATEKVANAVNHLATWSEETAAQFADEARINRAKQLAQLKAELRAVEAHTAEPLKVA